MRRWVPPRGDVVLGLVLAAASLVQVWGGGAGEPADRLLHTAVSLVWPGALVMRRVMPVGSLLAVMAALALYGVLRVEFFTAAQFLALPLATFSVGAHTTLRRGLLGLGLSVPAAATHAVLAAEGDPVGDAFFPLVLLGAPFVAGRLLRTYQERADDLERLSAEVARLAVADERARIARELHDAVAHSVNVAVIQAEAAAELLDSRPEAVREPLERIQQSGREALVEMRRMLGVLRPEDDVSTMGPPRMTDLPALVERVRETGLEVDLEINGRVRQLPPGLELNAYRIVQEALTNTLKHAAAAHAWVRVHFTDRALELEIADDGLQASGPGTPVHVGHGHVGLRERVALFRGDAESGPRPGRGWVVRARLPLDPESA